jgi:hypothetical protein
LRPIWGGGTIRIFAGGLCQELGNALTNTFRRVMMSDGKTTQWRNDSRKSIKVAFGWR